MIIDRNIVITLSDTKKIIYQHLKTAMPLELIRPGYDYIEFVPVKYNLDQLDYSVPRDWSKPPVKGH